MQNLSLFAALTLFATTLAAAEPRMNVLFIAIDDLKPVLGCYDDPYAQTPNLDRLASRSFVFRNAHCQWPVCGPSRASLLTSLRPEASGVMDLKTDVRAKNPQVLTLPQHFRNCGYQTAGVGKIYDPRCVDNKKDCDKPSWSIPFIVPKSKFADTEDDGHVFASPQCAPEDLVDGQIAAEAVRQLRALVKTDQPFLLAVGFKKPHLPFIAPQSCWDLYDPDKFELARHRGGVEHDSGYVLHDSSELRGYGGVPSAGVIAEPLQRQLIHGYYACVSFIDQQIGLLVDELVNLGLSEQTIIVVWGDHGFHLGDHGMWGKHSTLEQATRVPLIITAPGMSPGSSTSPVEFTDIFPTLCEFSGNAVPPQLNGRSLRPILSGSATTVRPGAVTVFKNKGSYGYSLRTERYRYTEWINKQNKVVARDLFDYHQDRLETRNMIDEPASKVLRQRLAFQLREVAEGCDRLLGSKIPD
jgi:arylsulfatase A-like enzyme